MSIANKFNIPPALLETIKKMNAEETEYQMKVKALMKKKGITSLGQLSPDEKKAFFNTLDSMHKAKHEEVKPDVAKSFPASGVKKHVAPKGVSTMPKDKEKAKGQPAGSLKKEEVELDEAIPKSTGYALVHSSSKKIVAKGNKEEMMKKMKEVNAKEKGSHHLGMTNRGKVGDTFGEEIELEEGKSGTGYELYHKDFSSAMQHAYDFAKKKYNIEIDPTEIDRNVAMGPRKPGSGKANAYRLLDKTGKKAIQVQVTNLDNKRYELNMYKEDVDLEESGGPVVYKKGDDHIEKYGDEKFAVYKNGKKTKYYKSMNDAKAALEEERDLPFTPDKKKKNLGVVPGKHGVGPSIAKHLAKMALKKQMDKKKPVKEEVEELEEGLSSAQIKTLRDAYAKIDKIDVSGQPYKNLVAFLDKQDVKTLKMLAGAKIKFISGMAQNRVVRKMNERIGMEEPGRVSGEVLGRQLEMFAREMLKKLTKEEASSPAQQAAIAISMKEKGKKPKNMKEQEGSGTSVNVNQSKRAALSMQMANLKMKQAKEREALQKKREALSDETQIDEYDSKGGVYQHRSGTYGKAKGSEYGDTDFDQENKMQKTLSKIKKAVKKGANQNRRTDTKLYKEEEESTKEKGEIKNSKKQVVKKGDTLSGKKETIIIEPELKDK